MEIAENSEEYVKRYFKELSQCGKEKPTGKQAEEYVKSYFKEIRLKNIDNHGIGFDYCDNSSKIFVEVKGSKKAFNHLQGWYLTEQQYNKVMSCQREKTKYEIHIVVGIGSESPEHYMEHSEEFLKQAERSINWWFRRPTV